MPSIPQACRWPTTVQPVLVFYSGGKDSLACLDLTVERYGAAHVIAVHMALVLGLDHTKSILAFAADRWGVQTIETTHYLTTSYLQRGAFGPAYPHLKTVGVVDIQQAMRVRTGGDWVVIGHRAVEGFERRAMLAHDYPGCVYAKGRVIAPIAWWSTATTLGYLHSHHLPLPKMTSVGRTMGISLEPEPMHWLRQYWPDDYKRVLKVFPFARAQADRFPRLQAEKDARTKAKREAAVARRRAVKAAQKESHAPKS